MTKSEARASEHWPGLMTGLEGPMLDSTEAMHDVAMAQAVVAARSADLLLPALPEFEVWQRPEATSPPAADDGPGHLARAWTFMRTCVHAAKLLPTVRHAIPRYVWPILILAALVKCLPLDFGTDEALFALAFLIISKRRPGLLKALYREAQAGRPVKCRCARHGGGAR